MKFISRFFLLIALIFLGLDIYQPIGAPGAADVPSAVNETAAGDGAASGDAASEETTSGDEAAAPAGETTTSLIPEGRVVLHQLGERWFDLNADSYLQVSPAVSRHVSPWLDDSIVQPLLRQPAFLIFFALSLVFSIFSWLIGRMRRDDW